MTDGGKAVGAVTVEFVLEQIGITLVSINFLFSCDRS